MTVRAGIEPSRGHDRRHAAGGVALEPDHLVTDRDDRLGQLDAGLAETRGGPRREHPVQVVALDDRLELSASRSRR